MRAATMDDGWQVRAYSGWAAGIREAAAHVHTGDLKPTCALLSQEPGAADVHVNNLSPEVDDATLAEAFGNCGRVLGATVFRDQMTGQR